MDSLLISPQSSFFPSFYSQLLGWLTAATVLLQFYVVYLIHSASPKSMRNYRFFLLNFTIWDLLFTVVFGWALCPQPLPPLIAITIGGFSAAFGRETAKFAVAATMFAGCNVICSQHYCLLYRLVLISGYPHIHRLFLSVECKLVCFFVCQSIAFAVSAIFFQILIEDIPAYLATHPDLELAPIIRTTSENTRPEDTIVVINTWDDLPHWFCGSVLILAVFSELLSGALIWTILRVMQATTHSTPAFSISSTVDSKKAAVELKKPRRRQSTTTQRLHLDFVRLLGIQLLTPVLFVVLPVVINTLMTFELVPPHRPTIEFAFLLLNLYGFANSILTVTFVVPYRKKVLQSLPFRFLRFVYRSKRADPNEQTNRQTSGRQSGAGGSTSVHPQPPFASMSNGPYWNVRKERMAAQKHRAATQSNPPLCVRYERRRLSFRK